MSAVISIKNLGKRYGKNVVLDKVNIDIRNGEFVAIVGKTGCGKTTMLRLVSGLMASFSGTIDIQAKKMGYLFQQPALLPWKTVKENIELYNELHNENMKSEFWINEFGLAEFLNHYPWQLSGGLQQRTALAMILLYDPDILLLDEPFSALDELTREKLNQLILDIWQKTKKTILFVTHNIGEAVFLADRIAVISEGKIREIKINLPRPRNFEIRRTKEFERYAKEIKTRIS